MLQNHRLRLRCASGSYLRIRIETNRTAGWWKGLAPRRGRLAAAVLRQQHAARLTQTPTGEGERKNCRSSRQQTVEFSLAAGAGRWMLLTGRSGPAGGGARRHRCAQLAATQLAQRALQRLVSTQPTCRAVSKDMLGARVAALGAGPGPGGAASAATGMNMPEGEVRQRAGVKKACSRRQEMQPQTVPRSSQAPTHCSCARRPTARRRRRRLALPATPPRATGDGAAGRSGGASRGAAQCSSSDA